jgi:hypothetical protein
VLVGLAYGVFELLKGYRQYLEFHSAGLVTQSSVYLAIAAMAAVGSAWEAHRSRWKRAARWFWSASVVVMVCGLFAMGSRNALIAFATVLLVLLIVLKDWRLWCAAALAIVAAVVLAVSLRQLSGAARVQVEGVPRRGLGRSRSGAAAHGASPSPRETWRALGVRSRAKEL